MISIVLIQEERLCGVEPEEEDVKRLEKGKLVGEWGKVGLINSLYTRILHTLTGTEVQTLVDSHVRSVGSSTVESSAGDFLNTSGRSRGPTVGKALSLDSWNGRSG